MNSQTKSLKNTLREAFEVSKKALPEYFHPCAPKKYTQPQLFCCLVVKSFYELDYRSTAAFIEDFSEIREMLQLKAAPHYATLQRACQRLLEDGNVRRLLEETLRKFTLKKMLAV